MDEQIKGQIRFVLDDDNEVLRAALEPGSDLDEDNRQMNRELIKRHERILAKLDSGELLSQEDLQLIRDANRIHLNDTENLNGHHRQAIDLNEWLDTMIELSRDKAMKILEGWMDKNPNTPAKVYRALHTLWEEATPNDVVGRAGFDDEGRCLRCGSRVSFANVTDTLVFVGDKVVKGYEGDTTDRHCVRCTCPEEYPRYKDWEGE